MSTAQVRIQATGKRKTSVARIILESGDGTITCNGRPIEDFFGRKVLVTAAKSPLVAAGVEGQFSVKARLDGGGISGQAGALRHAVARALVE
ncbi:MAG: 30S ribosomal protein S9, partial [Thermoleophilia bacterium]|nr:30S ribosomal protein S9 [Thermoleophilia bacterium]